MSVSAASDLGQANDLRQAEDEAFTSQQNAETERLDMFEELWEHSEEAFHGLPTEEKDIRGEEEPQPPCGSPANIGSLRSGPLLRAAVTHEAAPLEVSPAAAASSASLFAARPQSAKTARVVPIDAWKDGEKATNEAQKQQQASLSYRQLSAKSLKAAKTYGTYGSTSQASLHNRTVWRERLRAVVNHPAFDMTSGLLIFANAVLLGVQADREARTLDVAPVFAFEVCDIVFCSVFGLELALRAVAYGRNFFAEMGMFWALFDIGAFSVQLVEQLLKVPDNIDMSDASAGKVVRVMRILRLVRILRVVRMIRFLKELRTLTSSIVNAMSSLLWTLVLLFLLIYSVGVYFTQLIVDVQLSATPMDNPAGEALIKFFGRVASSMLSLFQVFTGGVDWDDVCSPLMELISPVQGVVLSLYVAFTALALTNVVTGVFVEGALKNARIDETRDMAEVLEESFRSAAQENGTDEEYLTAEQFEQQIDSKNVRSYLASMQVDFGEAFELFHLLDRDGSGLVHVEELVHGCMRLCGAVKAIDIMMVLFECRQLARLIEIWAETGNLSQLSDIDSRSPPARVIISSYDSSLPLGRRSDVLSRAIARASRASRVSG